MAYFTDAEEVYRWLGGLFEALAADPELWPSLAAADLVVQYRYRRPEAQITMRLAPGEPLRLDLGPSDLEADVVMTMDADVAHRFWLGKVNVPVALARGQMRARGPGGQAAAARCPSCAPPSRATGGCSRRAAGRTSPTCPD